MCGCVPGKRVVLGLSRRMEHLHVNGMGGDSIRTTNSPAGLLFLLISEMGTTNKRNPF